MRGRNAGATARVHSSDSAALQGLYFCVLALSVTRTRQLEVDLGIDVDVAVAVEVLDHRHLGLARDALDQALAAARDDRRRRSGIAISGPTAARSVVSTSCTASAAGRLASARCTSCAARGWRIASEPPRRMQALPLLIASDALDRGHVGAALVDHAETRPAHAHWPTANAARALAQVDDLADRVGHRGESARSLRRRSR
jgi:hypothetical protein